MSGTMSISEAAGEAMKRPRWYKLNPDHSVEPCELDADGMTKGPMQPPMERMVARTEINDALFVSTVFLALDHGYDATKPPVLFETMVFRNDEGENQWRYSTWDEAFAGHQKVCANLTSGLSREELETAKSLIEPLLKDK